MQRTQQPTLQRKDEGIDLFAFWATLVERKVLIFICFTVCLGAGIAFAYLKSPVYESNVKLRIGQIKSDGEATPSLLENAEELSARLLTQYGEDIAQGIKREHPFITQATLQRGVTTTLQLTAEGATADDAARLLNDVVKAVQRDHTVLFEDNRRPISDRLQNLEEQRATLQKQYADLTALIERLKASDSVQASLMMLQRGAIVDSLNQQDMERLRLAQQITPPQTRPTELLGEIVAPAKASRPKKMLVLAFSAAFGLMMGVILAFFMDFLAKAKPPERSADITYR
jgi:uncharacterized protein involved in exopolysaccharide biosynthesis